MGETHCPCGRELPPYAGTGRPRTYCGRRCRKRAEKQVARERLAAITGPQVAAMNRYLSRMR
jgi:hypothetical protein